MISSQRLTKMQLHYWEAKQTFLKKIKKEQDDCVVACDAKLDAKLELLKSIDETNQNLLAQLDCYQERILTIAQEECLIGRFLRECSRLDPTKAGKLMSGSGKTLLFSSHQTLALRVVLLRLTRDLETFQYRAVADTFDTVERMEKSRTAYRAALLWMKDLSKELDPDEYSRMDKFKRVQEHVRNTRVAFEKLKSDTIQKIDLLSASRTNLFSNLFASYQNSLKSLFSKSSKTMNVFVDTFQMSNNSAGYDFQVLKELNDAQTVNEQVANFESRLKEILQQDNINERDMLLFFEKDYNDDPNNNNSNERKNHREANHSRPPKGGKKKNSKNIENKLKDNIESLLDLTQATMQHDNDHQDNDRKTTANKTNLDILTENSSNFLPSSLIDLRSDFNQTSDSNTDPKNFDIFDQLIMNLPAAPTTTASATATSSSQFSITASSSSSTVQPSTLASVGPDGKNNNYDSKSKTDKNLDWLSLFSDIDPLSNAQEFDKISGDKKNC